MLALLVENEQLLSITNSYDTHAHILLKRHTDFRPVPLHIPARLPRPRTPRRDSLVLFFGGRLGDDRQCMDAPWSHLSGKQGVNHLVPLDEGQAVEAGSDDVQVEMALGMVGGGRVKKGSGMWSKNDAEPQQQGLSYSRD